MSFAENKLIKNPGALCNMVRRIALEAGEIVMKYYEMIGEEHIEEKSDGSPVSLADREAEAYIQMSLDMLIPGIPMIGEEAAELGQLPDLAQAEFFWLVDALDGTKEFLAGGEDFTVNIALIRNGQPFLGVVYAPASGVLYAGCGPGTAVRWSEDTDKEKELRVRKPPSEGLTVVASLRHGDAGRLDTFLEAFKIKKLLKKGSSLKICVIAEAKADLYPRLGPTSEWDTAAGDAVLRSAGGMMTDLDGLPLTYGGARPRFLNPEFVASGFAWNAAEGE